MDQMATNKNKQGGVFTRPKRAAATECERLVKEVRQNKVFNEALNSGKDNSYIPPVMKPKKDFSIKMIKPYEH